MAQLSSFKAVHYRCIDGLFLPHLSKLNLITGINGVGKTALIEAMWLFAGRYNPSLLFNVNVQRTLSPHFNPISRLTDGELELYGVEDDGNPHTAKFHYEKIDDTFSTKMFTSELQEATKKMPPVQGIIHTYLDGERHESQGQQTGRASCIIEATKFLDEMSDEYIQRYSALVRKGRKKELVKAMKVIAENIEDMEILATESKSLYLSVVIKDGKPRPLHDLGGGAVKLVRLLLDFSASQDGILLSDELENGFHYTVQREIWNKARQWTNQWNVQFVATTHSGEFIDAAIDTFADDADNLSIHKLFRDEKSGRTKVTTFTGETLLGARDLNLEVR